MKPKTETHNLCLWTDSRSLDRRVASILGCMDKHGYTPDKWSIVEGGGVSYVSPTDVVDTLAASNGTSLYLHRSKAPRFQAYVAVGKDVSVLSLEMKASLNSVEHYESFWALSSGAGALLCPLYGVVTGPPLKRQAPMTLQTWSSSENARDIYEMWIAPKCGLRHGLVGLGLRTFLGALLVGQIGVDRLRGAPGIGVFADGAGGVRVDLCERPWERSVEEILEIRRLVMGHLREAGVFSTSRGQEWAGMFELVWTKGPNFVDPYA